jgi:hypothetical protein
MAEPVSPVFPQELFPHREFVLGAGDTNAMPLPIYHDGTQFISRWKLTAQELEVIQRTGEVLISIQGGIHPPLSVMANDLEFRDGVLVSKCLNGEDPLERIAKL